MNETIKVVIADDHKLVRDGFKLLIRKHKRIKLVGEAGDGFELLEIAHKLHPDVVVLDIGMPRMDGIEATKRLKEELPDIAIIVLSMFASPATIEEIIEAGARGYLMKNADQEEMLVGIEAVNDGREFFCSESIKVLEQQEVNDKKVDFTEREIEIIKHICEQKSNKQIAAELKISPRTVESHRNTIMHKLRANNAAGVALYATRNRLI